MTIRDVLAVSLVASACLAAACASGSLAPAAAAERSPLQGAIHKAVAAVPHSPRRRRTAFHRLIRIASAQSQPSRSGCVFRCHFPLVLGVGF